MAAEVGHVISIHSVDQWNEQLQIGTTANNLVVVDFTASWCGPCRFIAPILAELAKKMPQIIFLKVDVDEVKVVAEEWRVEAMPTFVFLKEGKEVDRLVGANKDQLLNKVTNFSTLLASASLSVKKP